MFVKKICIFVLAAVFTFTTIPAGAAQTTDDIPAKYEEAVNRLMDLGILQGYEDGSFRAEKDVTRAEFTTIIMSILGISGTPSTYSVFDDVPAEHWASSNIKIASDMGIINGVGNGLFAPEEGITLEQALKITVEVLGYGVLANERGGYPEGYISVAADKRLLKGIDIHTGDKMTRGDVALLIDLALDVPMLQKTLGKDNYFKVLSGDNNTLYKQMMYRRDLINIRGVVLATPVTSIDGSDYLKDGFVKIGDGVYRIGDTNICDYLGYYVNAYVTDSYAKNANTVILYSLMGTDNKVLSISADDINEDTTLDEISYVIDERNKKKDISEAVFIYNGKHISRVGMTPADILVHNGEVVLLDNDENKDIDVVFITERESFIVDRIASGSKSVYFRSGVTFRGRQGFKIESDDTDKKFTIYDRERNIIGFSDIEVNDVVTFEISRDGNYGNIYVCDEKLAGMITAIKSIENIVMIDDVEYKLSKDVNGSINYSVDVGDEAIFLVDCDGFVVGDDENKTLMYDYAYVINSAGESGLSDTLKIKAVIPGKKEKITDVINNVENISYVFKNNETQVLETADKVRYTPEDGSPSKVSGRDIGSEIINKIIRYRTNTEGKITELQWFSPVKIQRKFNADLLSFGDTTYSGEGFVANDSTQFIMIPEKLSPADDDYLVEVEIADEATIRNMVPVMVDSDTQVAEAILIYAQMDTTTPKPFKSNTKVSVVGGITQELNDNDEIVYNLQVLCDDEIKESYVLESGWQSGIVSELIKGDLVRFNEKTNGEIDNIEKLASVQGLENSYFRSGAHTENEKIFGVVETIDLHRLVSFYNEYMDIISVNYMDGVAIYHIPVKNGPVFYMYNRNSGDISVASSDDIVSSEVAGDDATKIYMLVNNTEVTAVVLIVD